MISAVILIEAEPAQVAELSQQLVELDRVAEVYSVTGEYDIVAMVHVKEYDDLAQVVTHGISKLPGIRRTHTLVAFRAFRDADFGWDAD
jgi:DNA-binding Lrp family transcriptional regulator